MPVFALTDELVFPDPSQAEPDGLLALGGDLRPERLLLAYAHGIFPWNSEEEPLLWWSPAPRAVLVPGEIAVPRSLAKAIRRRPYRISLDLSFEAVIAACAETPRPGQDRTWITPGIRAAFTDLHRRGLAHSVEAWDGDRLVGGLYGLALGSVFCGESMFARADDASKIAFVALVEQLRRWEFSLIDCQVETAHLRRFGATPIERAEFMRRLAAGVARAWRVGVWTLDEELAGRADGGPPPRKVPPPKMWRLSRETGGERRGGEGGARSRRKRRGRATGDAWAAGAEVGDGTDAAAGANDRRRGAAEREGADELARGTGEARDAGGARGGGADEMARGTGEARDAATARGAGGAGAARGGGADEMARGTGEARDAATARGAGGAPAAGAGVTSEMSQGTGETGDRRGGE
ncbi:leucyl/phenylalanyl-tRNA--protein transferase [Nannocystis exedens]|uniref:Leucyl/phenylalanyl-tRNA--protein transferase n=1 Tax=Nannocystis exedens TaxID=54 RepID=A0A1I1Z8U1_9BACT|nr:leucyl/phenylalanyl-tRNA--protein transferase [Nannocystis exedens]SFE28097.1 leucyl/phenylalanyl-tRNA--protein transferase [Nannocystis exedens]